MSYTEEEFKYMGLKDIQLSFLKANGIKISSESDVHAIKGDFFDLKINLLKGIQFLDKYPQEHNEKGFLVRDFCEFGYERIYEYNDSEKIEIIKNYKNEVSIRYFYNEKGLLSEVKDFEGYGSKKIEYDSEGRIDKIYDCSLGGCYYKYLYNKNKIDIKITTDSGEEDPFGSRHTEDDDYYKDGNLKSRCFGLMQRKSKFRYKKTDYGLSCYCNGKMFCHVPIELLIELDF